MVELREPGKWLLFPKDDADAAWTEIETQTKNGTLGFAAKVAFEKLDNPVIMIYTYDSNDTADKRRVEQSLKRILREAGLHNVAANVRYKTDADTRAGKFSSLAPASKFKAGDAPSDICKFFANGNCKYGDECRFKHVAALGRAAGDGDSDIPVADCEICFGDYPQTDGIFCKSRGVGSRHFLCKGCINRHAINELNGEKATDGLVSCPHVDAVGAGRVDARCTAEPWTPADLQHWLSPNTSAQLVGNLHQTLKAKNDIVEAQRKEIEAARNKTSEAEALAHRVAEASRTAARKDRLVKVRNAIIDDVMYVRCPRCKTPFLEYDGCDALVCGTAGCGCGFCALCLKDCGKDAHQHLGQVGFHGNAARGFYGGEENFKRTHRDRRLKLLQGVFARMGAEEPEFLQELLRSMDTDLRDIGIDPAEVLPRRGAEAAPRPPVAAAAAAPRGVAAIIAAVAAAGRDEYRDEYRADLGWMDAAVAAGNAGRGAAGGLLGQLHRAQPANRANEMAAAAAIDRARARADMINRGYNNLGAALGAGVGAAPARAPEAARGWRPDHRPLAELGAEDLLLGMQQRYAELMGRPLNAREQRWDEESLQMEIMRITGM